MEKHELERRLKRRRLQLTLLICSFAEPFSADAQDPNWFGFQGHVYDKQTLRPLEGAFVQFTEAYDPTTFILRDPDRQQRLLLARDRPTAGSAHRRRTFNLRALRHNERVGRSGWPHVLHAPEPGLPKGLLRQPAEGTDSVPPADRQAHRWRRNSSALNVAGARSGDRPTASGDSGCSPPSPVAVAHLLAVFIRSLKSCLRASPYGITLTTAQAVPRHGTRTRRWSSGRATSPVQAGITGRPKGAG